VRDEHNNTASASKEVHVAPIDEVPGCSLALYTGDDNKGFSARGLLRSRAATKGFQLRRNGVKGLHPRWVTSSGVVADADEDTRGRGSPYETCEVLPDPQTMGIFDKEFTSNLIVRAQVVQFTLRESTPLS